MIANPNILINYESVFIASIFNFSPMVLFFCHNYDFLLIIALNVKKL
jgi:hypothetical protein